ncbi:MAG: hypothetical protein Q8J89_13390 [Caulobacter sp.]|nr:hypothetical protein [Caulobacter sp.]
MRLVLAITILAAGAVTAQAAEDRYGPPRARPVTAPASQPGALPASAAPYSGQMLSWSGKTPGQAPQPSPVVAAPVMPQPIAAWAGPAAAAPGPRAASYPSLTAPAPMAAAYAPAPRPVAPQTALPTSLYDRPASAPIAAAPAPPAPRYEPPARRQAVLAPPPSAPAPVRAPSDAGRSKAYSVLREFGGVPDPIDIPPPTSYWATRPGTAPVDAVEADFAPGGGVGADEVADANGQGEMSDAARRRERERDRARAAAAEAKR